MTSLNLLQLRLVFLLVQLQQVQVLFLEFVQFVQQLNTVALFETRQTVEPAQPLYFPYELTPKAWDQPSALLNA